MAKLQPFPTVAAKLMRLVSADDVAFRSLADLAKSDAAFSAEILHLANSPLLGCRRTVNSILHGVAILGIERLKSLVMMVALRNQLADKLAIPSLQRCWRHSLACAFVSQDIGCACWLGKDECYTAGLLHDLGRLSLLGAYPDEYTAMLEAVEESAVNLLEAERQTFEIDHCAVGCWLITEWDLPEDLIAVVGTHHSDLSEGNIDLAGVVRAACRIADVVGFQAAGGPPPFTLEDIVSKLPEPARRRWEQPDQALVELAGNINAVECSLL